MQLHFAYPFLGIAFLCGTLAVILIKYFFPRRPRYKYPMAKLMGTLHAQQHSLHRHVLFCLKAATLLALSFLIARPQWVDERSNIIVEGIDIVLALDVSESMMCFDDLKDPRNRLDVAKTEAIKFVEKRTNDPIALTIFGKEAVSRCPLTLDKNMIKEAIAGTSIGIIDPQGTWLGTGLATAINRLKSSQAKSKIIILLSDGRPTPPEKVDPAIAINMAKEFGVKVYTIGIGNRHGGYIQHPFFGVQQVQDTVDEGLLQTIAQSTGGKYFRADNPKQMKEIYTVIDALEKTKHETNLFSRYYEAFKTFIWYLLVLIAIEYLLKTFVWRGLS